MVAPQKYRSVFTGREIDEAIASMRAGSLGAGLIVNDFSGGVDKISSAELPKILRTDLDAANTGENIKAKLLSVPNTKVLTDAELARLTYLTASTAFRGVYANAAVRDAALASEVAGYAGNELSFLADDGSGDSLSELSRWDTTSNSWKKVKLINDGATAPQVVAAAGNLNMFSYRTNRYVAMKVLIAGSNAGQTQRQVQEALITHVGSDTYISVYNEIGNVSNLFTITSTLDAQNVTVVVQTLSANITIAGKILAMI